MWKKFVAASAACFAAGVMGFKFTDLGDYLRVVGRQTKTILAESVPTSMEIGRLEILMERIDSRLVDEEREHAKAEASLEKAEKDLESAKRRRDDWMSQLVRIRTELKNVGTACPTTKLAVEREFAAKVAGCERLCKAIEEREAAVAAQRAAVQKAGEEVASMRRQREVLNHRLASLKSTDQAQRLASAASVRPEGDAIVRQAEELAGRLTDRLELDRKVSERVAGWNAPEPAVGSADEAGRKLDGLLRRTNPPAAAMR